MGESAYFVYSHQRVFAHRYLIWYACFRYMFCVCNDKMKKKVDRSEIKTYIVFIYFFRPINSLRDNYGSFHFNTTETNKRISFLAVAGSIWLWPRFTNPGHASIIDQRIFTESTLRNKKLKYLQISADNTHCEGWTRHLFFLSINWREEYMFPPAVLWYALYGRKNLLPILIFV